MSVGPEYSSPVLKVQRNAVSRRRPWPVRIRRDRRVLGRARLKFLLLLAQPTTTIQGTQLAAECPKLRTGSRQGSAIRQQPTKRRGCGGTNHGYPVCMNPGAVMVRHGPAGLAPTLPDDSRGRVPLLVRAAPLRPRTAGDSTTHITALGVIKVLQDGRPAGLIFGRLLASVSSGTSICAMISECQCNLSENRCTDEKW